MTPVPLQIIRHQPSFVMETTTMRLALSRVGGCMAPVEFFRDSGRPVQPYDIPHWADTGCDPDTPVQLQALRGDFFCMPFGKGDTPFNGEQHPAHGQTAGDAWELDAWESGGAGAWMRLSMEQIVRPGLVEKSLALVPGENVVYSSHAISGMRGPMCMGHHPTLRFPDEEGAAQLSFSPWRYGLVYDKPFEDPGQGGYFSLEPGAEITELERVHRIDGQNADLTRYPARRGYEDLALIAAERERTYSWSAAVVESWGALWFSLKDPRVLPSTLLWHSNGGRHYPPWSGRHINTLGIEEICAYFHEGLASSASDNQLRIRGIPTVHDLSPDQKFTVNFIQGMARIPRNFGKVAAIEPEDDLFIRIQGANGESLKVPCRMGFLEDGDRGRLGLE